MSTLSSFLGTSKPQASIYGQRSALYQAKPDTAQVLGAYVEDAFKGEGTLSQDTRANEFTSAVKQAQNPYTEDEWKKSEFFREGLSFTPGMDSKAAEVLANTEDDRNDRMMIMEKASGWQKAGGIGASLITGIFEPKNLATGIAAGVITGGAGELATNAVRMKNVLKTWNNVNKYKRVAAIAGTEGAIAAAMSEPSNRDSSKVLQGDYTLTDSLLNFGLSTVLGAGIAAGHMKFSEARLARKTAREEVAIKEFDTAIAQLSEGRSVDVEHITELDNAKTAAQAKAVLPQIEEKINSTVNETGIRPVTETPEFKGWFGNSQVVREDGSPQVMYHGTGKDIEEFKAGRSAHGLIFFTEDPDFASNYSTSKAGSEIGANVVPVYLSAEKIHPPMKWSEAQGLGAEHFTDRGYDAVKIIDDGGKQTIAVTRPTQIKSIFNRGAFDKNDPRLHDVKRLEDLQIQKGKAESNSKAPVSEEPITRAVNETTKPDNSTAYNPKDSQDIKDFLDTTKADKMQELESNLEQTFATIQEMKKQGLLSKEELAILDELANIDAGVKLHDDVLTNAYMCLTRG